MTKEGSESDKLPCQRHMRWVPPFDKVDDDIVCVCLLCTTANSAGEKNGVGERGKDKGAVAPSEWFGAIPFHSTVITVQVF